MSITQLWVEKYRPKTIDQFIFQNEQEKKLIEKFISDQSIPHLLFAGVRGSGKTSLANILTSSLANSEDVLIINASDENSVDVIRDKIKSFAGTFAWGKFKIIVLEEADYITINGQAVLRRIMEDYVDTARFILTCNYPHKILPELHSRCQTITFKAPNKIDVTEYAATILLKEQIQFKIEDLDQIIEQYYPDVRKIINTLQQYTSKNTLILPTTTESNDFKPQILKYLQQNQWVKARQLIRENVSDEETVEIYRFLYENIKKIAKFQDEDKWGMAIITIAEHLQYDSLVADKEINMAACLIKLQNL